jgi:YidC/Oxa1 family membrane protein insertase
LLDWLYTAISWVLKEWHALFSTFLDPAGGITWALSIMMLVVTIRLLLFRLFIRQVKSQRAMQEVQPEIQKLRAQYGSDRQGFSQAVMALQKERGVNPLAGCLPILPQIPVFISLFHVLRRIAPGAQGLYGWSYELTQQAAVAKLFGLAPISASFVMQEPKKSAVLAIPGVTSTGIHLVAIGLIIVMCCTTYFTQKQIMKRSGPVEGQAAMVQKFMLYGMPLSLFASGFFFPIGVLLYWLTNNLWTLGQQFYILKKLPPPGSDAAKAKADAAKPAIDPKTLAPKPGAKPVRGKPGLPPTTATTSPGTPTTPTSADGNGGDGPSVSLSKGATASGDGGPSGGNGSSNGTPAGKNANRPRSGRGGGGAGPANRGKRKRR